MIIRDKIIVAKMAKSGRALPPFGIKTKPHNRRAIVISARYGRYIAS
jgi:hypothetical protein